MHALTINEEVVINLKESREEYTEEPGRRKGKAEML